MSNLIPFNYQSSEVRTILKDGQPWFVAKDVCEILEISNGRDAISRLDDDEVSDVGLNDGSQVRHYSIVNEAGLYSLILGSRKPEAKQFKRWITHEVIPSIRNNGAYMTPDTIQKVITNPDFIIDLATRLKKEMERSQSLEAAREADKPKLIFADAVSASNTTILIGELAKILKQNGVDIGEKRFFKWLRTKGYLISREGTDYNMPTQRSMELGLIEVKETSITRSNGTITVSKTTKCTGKAQQYFINKFICQSA